MTDVSIVAEMSNSWFVCPPADEKHAIPSYYFPNSVYHKGPIVSSSLLYINESNPRANAYSLEIGEKRPQRLDAMLVIGKISLALKKP